MAEAYRNPHEKTLFHLIPQGDKELAVLDHGNNGEFVSRCRMEGEVHRGLEVGYHTAKRTHSPRYLATLGREGELIIADNMVSRRHVKFEMLPDVFAISLTNLRPATEPSGVVIHRRGRGKRMAVTSVTVVECYVFNYEFDYIIEISGYYFIFAWHEDPGIPMKTRAEQLYKSALEDQYNYNAQDDPETIRVQAAAESHRLTRVITGKTTPVVEDKNERKAIGSGTYGRVYKTLDVANAMIIAVKEIVIENDLNGDERERVRRELKSLQACRHPHIVDLLGHSGLSGSVICYYMPWCKGSLLGLSRERHLVNMNLHEQVLYQMLQALDCLAFKRMCHRDVKPANILYDQVPDAEGKYCFKLADFGMARLHGSQNHIEGTPAFWAPEITRGGFQGAGVDIWALYVTLVSVQEGRDWPVDNSTPTEVVHQLVRDNDYFPEKPEWRMMAREDPSLRPSAAQCLEGWFGRNGLTTKDHFPPMRTLYQPAAATHHPEELTVLGQGSGHRSSVVSHQAKQAHRATAADRKQKQPMRPVAPQPAAQSAPQPEPTVMDFPTMYSKNGDVIMGGTGPNRYELRSRARRH